MARIQINDLPQAPEMTRTQARGIFGGALDAMFVGRLNFQSPQSQVLGLAQGSIKIHPAATFDSGKIV